jgi:drug/metabolite transporter (DMT)-like permease
MGGTDLALMALIGLLAGAGHCFLVLALRHAPASVVSPFQYTQELWGILYGWILFGNLLDGPTVAGAGVIIGAGFLAVRRQKPA